MFESFSLCSILQKLCQITKFGHEILNLPIVFKVVTSKPVDWQYILKDHTCKAINLPGFCKLSCQFWSTVSKFQVQDTDLAHFGKPSQTKPPVSLVKSRRLNLFSNLKIFQPHFGLARSTFFSMVGCQMPTLQYLSLPPFKSAI